MYTTYDIHSVELLRIYGNIPNTNICFNYLLVEQGQSDSLETTFLRIL